MGHISGKYNDCTSAQLHVRYLLFHCLDSLYHSVKVNQFLLCYFDWDFYSVGDTDEYLGWSVVPSSTPAKEISQLIKILDSIGRYGQGRKRQSSSTLGKVFSGLLDGFNYNRGFERTMTPMTCWKGSCRILLKNYGESGILTTGTHVRPERLSTQLTIQESQLAKCTTWQLA